VLVVEDNPDVAHSMSTLLRMWGHEARVALNGPSALEKAHEEEPEVVLLDIGLPGMDGYEVARKLRDMLREKGTLFVVVSGYGTEADIQRSREEGIELHFVKPADPAELREVLQRYGSRQWT